MRFDEIIGHNFIKESLIDTVKSGKASHAYIFDGPEGVGKLKTAKIFARAILCDNFTSDLCEQCNSCHLTRSEAHPDLKVLDLTIGEDGKQKASISVEAIRQLKKEVYLRPFYGNRKIYILKNAEKMTVEAQNAMLKIFEEPPEYITIILISNGLSKILPTIKSRAVIFKFPALKPKELEMYLNKYYNSIDNKKIYASISGGSISKMSELISDPESLNFRNMVLSGIVSLINGSGSSAINQLFDIFMKNKDLKFYCLEVMSVFLMDVIYIKTANADKIVNVDAEGELKELALKLTVENICNIEKLISELWEKLLKNSNYKLAVISTLLKIREEIYG